MNADQSPSFRRTFAGSLAIGALLFGSAGCSLFHKPETAPNIAAPGQGNLTPAELQNQVIRFADAYSVSVAHAADAAAKSMGTKRMAKSELPMTS